MYSFEADQPRYCRSLLATDYGSLSTRPSQVLVQVSVCVAMPGTSVFNKSRDFFVCTVCAHCLYARLCLSTLASLLSM